VGWRRRTMPSVRLRTGSSPGMRVSAPDRPDRVLELGSAKFRSIYAQLWKLRPLRTGRKDPTATAVWWFRVRGAS
jgi:hypothetical protein